MTEKQIKKKQERKETKKMYERRKRKIEIPERERDQAITFDHIWPFGCQSVSLSVVPSVWCRSEDGRIFFDCLRIATHG